jgi:hypothetical protein
MEREAEKLYYEFRNHLIESRHKSYEQFDKAVFLLSGGGLTISLTFIKDLIPFVTAASKNLLVTSWVLFVIPLILTLLSFILSQKALDRQIELTDDYFQNDNTDALNETNVFANITRYSNYASAIFFVAGVTVLLRFVYINIL